MGVPLEEWVRLLDKEYLTEFIASGGAATKFAVAPPEKASIVQEAVTDAARQQSYFVAPVHAGQTRMHMIDQVFHAVARQVNWDALAERWLRAQFPANGYDVLEEQSLQDLRAVAEALNRPEMQLRGEITRWIDSRILKNYRLCKDFRTAMAMLCIGYINPQNVSPTDADTIKQWLLGEKCNLTALKRVQIYQKIGRHNARLFLNSFAVWLHEVGYSGLTLILDINAVVTANSLSEQTVRYTRNTLLDTYEVLRQFIDDTDETTHLLTVVIAGPNLLDDPRRSVENYTALKLRTVDEVHDRHRANPLNALVRMDGLGAEGGAA